MIIQVTSLTFSKTTSILGIFKQYSFELISLYVSISETSKMANGPPLDVRDDKKRYNEDEEDVRGVNVSFQTINENQRSEDKKALR